MIRYLLFTGIALFSFDKEAFSQPGTLDNTFGQGGKVVIDINNADNVARTIIVQPNGKTIIIGYTTPSPAEGYFSIARLEEDGSLDESFGTNGIVETHFYSEDAAARSGVLQPDGKILVAGYVRTRSNYNFALMRYTSAGTRDHSFGEGGFVVTDFGDNEDKANQVVLQADGKIVVVGSKNDSGNFDIDVALARYESDGTLDPGFGDGGKVVLNIGEVGLWQSATCVAMQPDGMILVGGYTEFHDDINETYNRVLLVSRFLPNGILDNSFGTGGIVQTSIGKDAAGMSLATQANGRILLLGQAKLTNGGYEELVMVRYKENGSLDSTFGNNGVVFTSFDNADDYGSSILVQPDQKILAAGYTAISNGTTLNFALARYLPNGALDNTFGSGGKTTTDFANDWDFGTSIAMHQNGKIMVAGYSKSGNDYDFAIARYLNDEALPVKLETFLAYKEDESVKLSWQTSSESNSDHFEIHRSNDGENWKSISSVAALHHSDSLSNYFFIDKTPVEHNYYRLKMVDADGSFAFSQVRSVAFDEVGLTENLLIFPNPASDHVTVRSRNFLQIEEIVVSDLNGTITPMHLKDGNTIDIGLFQPGIYNVIVKYAGSATESRKLLIQR